MVSIINKRWLVGLTATIAVAVIGGSLAAGCKPKNHPDTSPVGSASGSASAKASTLTGPCKEFADGVCAKAGKDSSGCKDVTSMAEMLSPAACTAAKRDIGYTVSRIEGKRKACTDLVSRLCKELGEQTETCKMVQKQTKTFQPERCTMMLGRYAEVLADLKKMEDQNKPLSPEKVAMMAKNDAPSFGPADAKVTIVEFSDFQCPYCSRAADVAHKVKEKYSEKVRFVFRQFPLSFHQNAHGAAEAAMAANAQGKFWEMHDIMFKNQGALDRANLEKHAAAIGLDIDKFKAALDNKEFAAAVDADVKMGGEVAVQGTPSMFLNGKRVSNPTDFDALSQMIDAAL